MNFTTMRKAILAVLIMGGGVVPTTVQANPWDVLMQPMPLAVASTIGIVAWILGTKSIENLYKQIDKDNKTSNALQTKLIGLVTAFGLGCAYYAQLFTGRHAAFAVIPAAMLYFVRAQIPEVKPDKKPAGAPKAEKADAPKN